VPQVNYPPKLRKIITAHLDELNTGGLTLPDGSGRPLPHIPHLTDMIFEVNSPRVC